GRAGRRWINQSVARRVQTGIYVFHGPEIVTGASGAADWAARGPRRVARPGSAGFYASGPGCRGGVRWRLLGGLGRLHRRRAQLGQALAAGRAVGPAARVAVLRQPGGPG